MAQQDKLTDLLYNGILAFYPDVAKEIFGLKETLPFYEVWHEFKRLEFLEFVLTETKKDTIEEAAFEVKRWKEEGVPPERTVPEKERLEELVAELEEKEQQKAAAYEKARLAKQILLESQKAKEAAAATLPTPKAVQPLTEKVSPPPSEEVSLGIKITPETGRVLQKFTNRVISAPFRAAISFGAPTLKAEEPARAAALTFLAKGVTSEQLEKKTSELNAKHLEKIQDLIKAIKNEETLFSTETRRLKQAFPVKEVTFLLGPESGLTQAQIAIFFRPEDQGGIEAVPHRSFLGDLFNRFGQQVFGKVSNNLLKKGAEKAATKLAEKAATKAVTEAVTTTVAVAAGPEGWAIKAATWLASELLPKVLRWVKEHLKDILGVGLVATGLFVGGGVGVSLAIGGGLVWLGGMGLMAAGHYAGGFMSFFVSNLLIPTFAKPIVAILIGIPVCVAILLFIINSGAYLVPPGEQAFPGENPYIGVKKEVSPSSFENSNLPVTVTYTITVTAKRGSLTSITFGHECEILRDGPTLDCPAPLPTVTPTIISPTEAYVFTYTQTYAGGNYVDSLVLNTFSVTANAEEVTGTNASASSSVIIGNPPTGCFVPVGTWPANFESNLRGAITYLTSNQRVYVAKVCTGGDIQIRYDSSPNRYWGWAADANNITLYAGGLGNTTNATYILAHESGHILSWRLPNLMQQYFDTSGLSSERPLCSYDATTDPYEAFAEAAALYGSPKTFSCMNYSFRNRYPTHWGFEDSVIFR